MKHLNAHGTGRTSLSGGGAMHPLAGTQTSDLIGRGCRPLSRDAPNRELTSMPQAMHPQRHSARDSVPNAVWDVYNAGRWSEDQALAVGIFRSDGSFQINV